MAGYSGTPLPQKLGIKPQFRVALRNVPSDVQAELKSVLASCNIANGGPIDFAMIFVKTAVELKKQFLSFAKGSCRDVVGKLAEEGLRCCYRPQRERGAKDWVGGGTGRCKSVRGERDLVGIEVRDQGEGPQEE
jgi:hypothetical protein